MSKRSILVFVDWYEPGYKGGGPIRSVAGFVDNLSSDFNIFIVTRDTDLNSRKPYGQVKSNQWIKREKYSIIYLSKGFHLLKLYTHLRNQEFDWLYLNSLFSLNYSIIPFVLYRIGLIKSYRVLIAPRGELKPERLVVKRNKKLTFLSIFRSIYNIGDLIFWHATSAQETSCIVSQFKGSNIFEADNLKRRKELGQVQVNKDENQLRIVFISRIVSYKNLHFVIEALREFSKKNVILEIYGPIEDSAYFSQCLSIIDEDSSLVMSYMGELEHGEVAKVFSRSHLFFFPTKGENYGHVIAEALEAGCPVLISDQTPWSDVNKFDAGWSFSLEERGEFQRALREIYEMGDDKFQIIRNATIQYAKSKINSSSTIETYRTFLTEI